MKKIVSIICAYFPCNEKLSRLVNTLLSVGDVVVVNNGGDFCIDTLSEKYKCTVIDPSNNMGTLAAYNFVINDSMDYDYYWLWDQDTEISLNEAAVFIEKAGVEFDQNKSTSCVTVYDKKNYVSPWCKDLILIKASTTLISSHRTKNLIPKLFDENLFMDYGDWDFSFRLYKLGGRVKQINGVEIIHQLGDVERTLLGAFNRPSVMRLHMQGINSIYLFRKHGLFNYLMFLLFARLLILPFKNFLFSDSSIRNRQFLAGLIFGFRGGLSNLYMKNKKNL